MVLADNWTFGDAILVALWVFFLIIWIWILIAIISDLFRDHTVSAWAKALWIIALVIVPFLTALVYIIARGHGMAERNMKQAQQAQQQMDDYIKQTAGESNVGDQLHKLDELRSKGSISQEEFDTAKAKLLSA
jgi:ABC-type multidrug transport system fused ATPase/permease subunit